MKHEIELMIISVELMVSQNSYHKTNDITKLMISQMISSNQMNTIFITYLIFDITH